MPRVPVRRRRPRRPDPCRADLGAAGGDLAELPRRYGEGHWADRITDAIRRINDGDLSGVDYLLRAFGGMGSLNDLLIHEANGHSIAAVDVGPVNDRLDELRTRVYSLSPLDPACPGPGFYGGQPERGSSRSAGTGCRSRDTARRRWSRRCSSRLVLVTATSASTGMIMSAAAASVRARMAGRRSGAGAGDQVTVTDSHRPALLMAPPASSRRQCPRDSRTCCGQRAWLSRGRG